jgi:GxxExxY protein
MKNLIHAKTTDAIIRSAIDVHRSLGPGLLESAYEECLAFELGSHGIEFVRQSPLPVVYRGVRLDCGYRLDFVVQDKVIVEVKSVEKTAPIHEAQRLTYLRLSGKKVGLLINFNVTRLIDGVTRRVS